LMGWIGLYWVRLCTCIAEERITEMFSPEISVHLPSKKVGTVYTSHPSSQPPYTSYLPGNASSWSRGTVTSWRRRPACSPLSSTTLYMLLSRVPYSRAASHPQTQYPLGLPSPSAVYTRTSLLPGPGPTGRSSIGQLAPKSSNRFFFFFF
jgi:hypothetical protein